MEPLEAAYTIAAVLGFICAVLLVYIWILSDEAASERDWKVWWRDAWANEAERHSKTRDELEQMRLTRRRA